MKDDIILNKIETIKHCLVRIKEEYIGFEKSLESDYTKQDSIVLNLERASQACIDVSTHVIRVHHFGIPKTSRDVFTLLYKNKVLSLKTSEQMKKMVGFRNIAVHDYQNISLDIVISIVTTHLVDFERFIKEVLMHNNIAIKVENLSKIYHLYDKPQDRLKEALNPFKKSYRHDFYTMNDVSFEIKKGVYKYAT